MHRALVVSTALLAAGCLESGVARCADGTICAAGLACDSALGCVSLTPCVGHDDGDRCTGVGVPAGTCIASECVMLRCGDGMLDLGEDCDDANMLSHDGCSSGCAMETPGWDGVTTSSPGPRAFPSMAYDRGSGRVVLFGGDDGVSQSLGDTWELDNGTWQQRVPTSAPSSRKLASMAYDDARGRIVLFGGLQTSPAALMNDTWEWNGVTWTMRSPGSAPPGRYGHAMAYDSARGRLVVFGGMGDSMPLADTWEWDGTSWTQRTGNAPSERIDAAMAYDPIRRRIVLFGGRDLTLNRSGDTWEWDGTSWSERTPPAPPLARSGAAMAYDPARGRVVMFGGGTSQGPANDTWAWDGSTWSLLELVSSPPARASHALVADAVSARLVAFGGVSINNYYGDTWAFRFSSGDPDETCVATEDADADGLAGCADPDCWGVCTPLCPPQTTCP